MNIHIFVRMRGPSIFVEAYSSRRAMISRKNEFADPELKLYMFPPIRIERSVEGVLKMSRIVDDIHVQGPVRVLERLEREEVEGDAL